MEYRRKEEEVPLLLKTKLQNPLREWSMMYILLCEIFEGLCIKGLVTVLAIFCLENQHFNENTSTELIHLFFMASAASNTIGSVVSEAFLAAINHDMQNTSESMAQNISIIWQIPQYVMMALGAGMMIIPRLEFAYHEAPANMKSAINGVLATISGTGNLLTVVITALLEPNASKVETLFVFSFVGAVGTLVMGVCSETYVSRHTTEFRKQRNSLKRSLLND